MKNHDWLDKTGGRATRDAGNNHVKNLQAVAFERVAADPGKQWREDGLSKLAPWDQVPIENKVGYLSWYAAMYKVPYDRLVKAVLDTVGEQGLAGGKIGEKGLFADEPWTLRSQFEGARKSFGLAPDPSPGEPRPEKNQGREV